jgi:hypothetical protein
MSSTINALTSGGGLAMAGDTSGQLQLQTNNGTTAITIDTSQNVGIGTASPAYKLNVVGGSLGISNLSAVPTYYNNAAQTGDSGSSSATRTLMQLQTSGTQSTASVLTVQGTIHPSVYRTILDSSTGSGASAPLAFQTGGTEAMRIDSSGNLLVGATSAARASRVYIKGPDDNSLTIDSPSGAGYTSFYFYQNGVFKVAQLYDVTNTRFVIQNVSGGVYLSQGATSWTAISDETRKDIIEPITGGLEKVATLRTVIGKLKTDEEGIRRPYLIAQDVQKVLPEAVTEAQDKDGKVLGLSYSEVIPLLVNAIQELNAKVEAQAATIAELQAKVG